MMIDACLKYAVDNPESYIQVSVKHESNVGLATECSH